MVSAGRGSTETKGRGSSAKSTGKRGRMQTFARSSTFSLGWRQLLVGYFLVPGHFATGFGEDGGKLRSCKENPGTLSIYYHQLCHNGQQLKVSVIRFQATHDLCLDSIFRMPSIAPLLLALPTRMTSWARPSRELRLGHAGTYSSCWALSIMVMFGDWLNNDYRRQIQSYRMLSLILYELCYLGMLQAQIFWITTLVFQFSRYQELQDVEKALQDALESTDCLFSNFYGMGWSWEFAGS